MSTGWYFLVALSILAQPGFAKDAEDSTARPSLFADASQPGDHAEASNGTQVPGSDGIQKQPWDKDQRNAVQRVEAFHNYWVSVIPWVALVLNSLSFFVWAFIGRRADQPTRLFLMALAVADILSLINMMDFAIFFWTGHKYSFQQSTDVGCKLIQYIANTARNCSSYFILGFTIDRFLSIWFPMNRRNVISTKRVAIAMAITVVLSAVTEIYMPILLGHHKIAKRCAVEDPKLMTLLSSIFRNGLGFLLPMILVAILNGLIITRLRQYRTLLEDPGESGRTRKAEARNRSLTIMLVVVSVYSFVVYLPKACVFYVHIGTENFTYSLLIAYYIVDDLAVLNFTCNFFFYCLAMPRFRRVLGKPLRTLRRKGECQHFFDGVPEI